MVSTASNLQGITKKDLKTSASKIGQQSKTFFSDETNRVLSVAAALFYEKELSKSAYVSAERHFIGCKTPTTFVSTFADGEHTITVNPNNGGYGISIDGSEEVFYPSVQFNQAIINFGSDIIQPININTESVTIQFQGKCATTR